MQFVRDVLDIPVPRVLAWNSRADSQINTIGAEYILLEKVIGTEIRLRWDEIAKSDTEAFLTDLWATETKLSRLKFSQIGSLYFKEDVNPELQSRQLFSSEEDCEEPILKQASERYRIGPLVDRVWWRGERATMDLDFGPCQCAS